MPIAMYSMEKFDYDHKQKPVIEGIQFVMHLEIRSGQEQNVKSGKKVRIDKLVFERGFAPSRERAQAYVMSGSVFADERKIEKPGTKVAENAEIRIKGIDRSYVSRGGLKLEKALDAFGLAVADRVAMDVGASTGGFTDCLLRHGASYVFAIDVGYGQLAWKLVSDARVKNLEKTNFRHMEFSQIGRFVDLIVVDVSFISLKKILDRCLTFLVPGGHVVALVKPQFEAGRGGVEKRGLVGKESVRAETVASVRRHAESIGYAAIGSEVSPIPGKKSGNVEYFLLLRKK